MRQDQQSAGIGGMTRRAGALTLAAFAALGAGQAMGVTNIWSGSGDGSSWSQADNWVGGVNVPGDTNGALSTNADYAYFDATGTAHPNVTVDAGRAVKRLYVGGGYMIGDAGGNVLTLTSGGYIWGSGPAGTGTISAPLNVLGNSNVQVGAANPLIFNGDITTPATTINLTVLNSTGTVTYNGSMSGAGRYYANGGDADVILNNANSNGGIFMDVTRVTYVLSHAGAVTNAAATSSRGGNFEINTANAVTGSSSINATATYVGTLSATNGVYGSVVTINKDNDYTGSTTVNGAAVATDRLGLDSPTNGALWVNNGHNSPGSATGSGNVTVSGGLLAGDGRIVNTGTNGVKLTNRSTVIAKDGSGNNMTGVAQGRLAPGASAGAVGTLVMNLGSKGLDVSGAVDASNSQSLLFDLVAPGSSDQVSLLNTTVLNIGTGNLEFDDFAFNLPDTTLASGVYTLFDSSQVIDGSLGTSLSGTLDGKLSTLSLGDSGKGIILTVVPEPGTLGVLAFGALGLLARRQRLA